MFDTTTLAGWGDMDFNGHMRNTAYLDKAADARMLYFSSRGFPMAEFMRLRLGPVVSQDAVEYFREFHLLDPIRVTFMLSGLSDDGSRMGVCNEFFRADGRLAARVKSAVGWLDLNTRRLAPPPAALLEAIQQLVRTEDFAPIG